MRHCDLYTKELSTLFRGQAVHNPRRERLQSGSALRPPINIGDIAYNYEGQLIRLFNCLQPREEQDADCVFPDNFEILEGAPQTRTRNMSGATTIHIKESYSRPGPFCSQGVLVVKATAGISAVSTAGAQISFSTRHEQGAVLVTSDRVKTRRSPNRPAFEDYMIKNYDSWCALLASMRLKIRPEELMLITAVDSTQAWSNIVFSNHQLSGEFSVDVPSLLPLGGQVSTSIEFRHTQSATRDYGPNPEDLVCGSDSPGSSVDQETIQDDQVIFVRALRAKKRNILLPRFKIIASADPKNLDDDTFSDGGSSALSLESVEETGSPDDELISMLDCMLEVGPLSLPHKSRPYPLQTTDADMALIHDDDYTALRAFMQSGGRLSADLVQWRTEGGVKIGTLTYEDAMISKQPENAISDFCSAVEISPNKVDIKSYSDSKCYGGEKQFQGPDQSNIPATIAMQQPTCTNVRIRSVADAHAIFYAVEQRYLPMIHRRLDSEERRAIRSGCVYVWEERASDGEAAGLGIERWTDSIRWGPSRVRDEFLFYHEKELDFDFEALGPQFANMVAPGSLSARKERLVKQTYAVHIDTALGRRKWHLIAYFTQEMIDTLRTVDQIPSIAALRIPPGRYRSARAVKGRGGGSRQPPEHSVTTPSPPRSALISPRYAPYHKSSRLSSLPIPVLPPLWPAVRYDLSHVGPSGNTFKETEHGIQMPPLSFLESTNIPKRCPVDEWALRSFDIAAGLNFPPSTTRSSAHPVSSADLQDTLETKDLSKHYFNISPTKLHSHDFHQQSIPKPPSYHLPVPEQQHFATVHTPRHSLLDDSPFSTSDNLSLSQRQSQQVGSYNAGWMSHSKTQDLVPNQPQSPRSYESYHG